MHICYRCHYRRPSCGAKILTNCGRRQLPSALQSPVSTVSESSSFANFVRSWVLTLPPFITYTADFSPQPDQWHTSARYWIRHESAAAADDDDDSDKRPAECKKACLSRLRRFELVHKKQMLILQDRFTHSLCKYPTCVIGGSCCAVPACLHRLWMSWHAKSTHMA